MKNGLIFFIVVSTFYAKCQNDVWLEARPKLGFLVAHRPIMGHLANEHAFASEVSYRIQPRGSKAWHQVYKYPSFGITGFIGSVGNQELMGNYYGSYGFMNFSFVKRHIYSLSGKLGTGVAYGSKIYDPIDNILSIAVGSHFNAMVVLALENRFELGFHSITAGIDVTHFSNGASKIPNLGLNLPFISLGYGYRLSEGKSDSTINNVGSTKNLEFGGIGILSQKQVAPIGGRHYPVFALNLIGRKYFNLKAGLEVSLDVMSKQAILGFEPDVPKTQADLIQVGFFAGYIMPLDHLHMILGMGYYLRDKYEPEDPVYHRVGMRYVFSNGINLNLALKTHFARADYFEYGIGYTFKR